MKLIELNDIYKTYHMGEIDVPVLKGVSLSVSQGEFVALMGTSGSGKTTLMNILGCLDRPTSSSESHNEYAREFVAATGIPSQRLHFIDPDKGRVAAEYVVWLD